MFVELSVTGMNMHWSIGELQLRTWFSLLPTLDLYNCRTNEFNEKNALKLVRELQHRVFVHHIFDSSVTTRKLKMKT